MKREYLLLVLVTLLAAGLRFYDLTSQSLWADEASSIYVAKCIDLGFMKGSLVDVTHERFFNPDESLRNLVRACSRNESAPPAYFISLAIWIKAFGSSELAVRSLSAILGTLTIPLFFLLGRSLFHKSGTALLSSLFIAVKVKPWFATMAAVGTLYAPWLIIGLRPQIHYTALFATAGPKSLHAFFTAYLGSLRHVVETLILGPMYSRWIIGGLSASPSRSAYCCCWWWGVEAYGNGAAGGRCSSRC
ncbi:MAG: glycosyltransferase family 39 protein [bacterium]